MAASSTYKSVLEVVNEVRRLVGHNTVTKLDGDKNSLVLMRLLNVVVAEIGNYGDWQEMYSETKVTASASTVEYTLGITHPVQRIYEIALSGQQQALYTTTIEKYKQWRRAGGNGNPRHFVIMGVDAQSNPKFSVHPQPVTAQAGNAFTVVYYKKQSLYEVTDADDTIPFPANVAIQGLYAAALVEEGGGQWTREALQAQKDFQMLMDSELKKFNTATGTDIYLQPTPHYRR